MLTKVMALELGPHKVRWPGVTPPVGPYAQGTLAHCLTRWPLCRSV